MGLKALVSCCVVIGCSLVAYTQQSKIIFNTDPMNAKLILDGEEIGDANGRKVKVGFNQRKGIVQHVFVVKAAGYEDKEIIADRSIPARKFISVKLERSLPSFEFETPFLIDLEMIQSGIAYSTNVGNNTKWKYKFDEEIAIGEKRLKILDAMERMEMPTLRNAEEGDDAVARIQVKGIVQGLDIKRGRQIDNYSPYSKYNTINTTIKWQFYDRVTKEVFFAEENQVNYEFSNSEINEEFYNGIVENFLVMFNLKPSVARELNEYDQALVNAAKLAEEAARKADIAERQAVLDSIANAEQIEEIGSALTIDSSVSAAVNVQRRAIRRPIIPLVTDPIALEAATKRAVVTLQPKGKDAVQGGTVISSDGYIVTNYLDSNISVLDVQFSNGILLEGFVVLTSDVYHVALVKVEASSLYALPIIEDMASVNGENQVISWESADIHTLDAMPAHGKLLGKQDPDGVRKLLTNILSERVSAGAALIDAQGRVIGIIDHAAREGALSQMTMAIDARYINLVLGIRYE
ncbi:MAG: trypsin-like peptidase domain-containing protein [Flavobacteriales bacterium]|nr:trypsin-like peptidase domain-containing protein [Flavobacteriales bacterium]